VVIGKATPELVEQLRVEMEPSACCGAPIVVLVLDEYRAAFRCAVCGVCQGCGAVAVALGMCCRAPWEQDPDKWKG